MPSIGTARHFQPHGTPGHVCRDHNRAALAAVVATEALRKGYGPDLSDAQLDECAELAERSPLSETSREAVRAALCQPLTHTDSPEAVREGVFGSPPGRPLRVLADGQEYFLVPIPITL
jgi:hypothetical protein